MSDKPWKRSLQTVIEEPRRSSKIALVGIGHELRGDDAAGLRVVRGLTGSETLLVIEAGAAPENHTHTLRRFQPALVLLFDAAQMNLAPGEIRLIDLNAIDGFGASTHTTPLTLFAQYVCAALGCEALLVGIQPGNSALDAPLTPEVKRAVRTLRRALQASLGVSTPTDA